MPWVFVSVTKNYIFTFLVTLFEGLPYNKEQRLMLANYIDSNKSGVISYREWKQAFRLICENVTEKWQLEVMEKLNELFHKNRLHLKAAFAFFDKDGSGIFYCIIFYFYFFFLYIVLYIVFILLLNLLLFLN